MINPFISNKYTKEFTEFCTNYLKVQDRIKNCKCDLCKHKSIELFQIKTHYYGRESYETMRPCLGCFLLFFHDRIPLSPRRLVEDIRIRKKVEVEVKHSIFDLVWEIEYV